jgi:hypothetical protein
MESPPLPRREAMHSARLVVSAILQSTPLAIGAVGAEDLGEGTGIEPVPAEPEEDRTVLEKQDQIQITWINRVGMLNFYPSLPVFKMNLHLSFMFL